MRKIIDRTAGMALAVATGALLGWAATGRITAAFGAGALAAVLALLTWRAWLAGPGRRRQLAGQRVQGGRALVAQWARRPDLEDLRQRLDRRYGPGDYALVLRPIHALGPALTASQVLDCWREYRGRDQLLICATGPVSSQARAAARELEQPVTRLLDGAALARIAAWGDMPLPQPPKTRRRLILPLPQRSRAPAILAYGAVMLAMYLVLGWGLYLALGLALMGLGMICLKRPGAPDSLF